MAASLSTTPKAPETIYVEADTNKIVLLDDKNIQFLKQHFTHASSGRTTSAYRNGVDVQFEISRGNNQTTLETFHLFWLGSGEPYIGQGPKIWAWSRFGENSVCSSMKSFYQESQAHNDMHSEWLQKRNQTQTQEVNIAKHRTRKVTFPEKLYLSGANGFNTVDSMEQFKKKGKEYTTVTVGFGSQDNAMCITDGKNQYWYPEVTKELEKGVSIKLLPSANDSSENKLTISNSKNNGSGVDIFGLWAEFKITPNTKDGSLTIERLK